MYLECAKLIQLVKYSTFARSVTSQCVSIAPSWAVMQK